MKNFKFLTKFKLLYSSFFLLTIAFFACQQAGKKAPADKMETSAPSLETASAPNQSIPVPNPQAFDGQTNLAFHQISWEYFNWLTYGIKKV